MPFSYSTLMCTLRGLMVNPIILFYDGYIVFGTQTTVPRNDLEPELKYDRHRSHKAPYSVNANAGAVHTSSARQADLDLGESDVISATVSSFQIIFPGHILIRHSCSSVFRPTSSRARTVEYYSVGESYLTVKRRTRMSCRISCSAPHRYRICLSAHRCNSSSSMPTVSERQDLIRTVLRQADIDSAEYLDELQLREDDEMDIDADDLMTSDSDGETTSGTSETSSTSSCSSSSSGSSSSASEGQGSDAELSDDDEDEVHAARMIAYGDFLHVISQTRVLNPHTVAKAPQLHLVLVEFKQDDPKRFRRNLRVSPDTFDELILQIQGHPIFHNNSHRAQTPIEIQLAITLFRFGHDGNAASVESIAQWAGVSVGLVVKSTQRVIIAFLSLHDLVIRWPTEVEKDEAKEWVEEASCPEWAGGFCMVDGTLVPLFEKPGHHGEVYFDRKSNYSLNVQVSIPAPSFPMLIRLLTQLVTLPNLRVIDYVVGHCGSAHDSTAFCDSRTYREHRTLFKSTEWMWADSAYGLDWWCVTPYKKPASLQANNRTFNYHLSRVSHVLSTYTSNCSPCQSRCASSRSTPWAISKAVSAPCVDFGNRSTIVLIMSVHWLGSKPAS